MDAKKLPEREQTTIRIQTDLFKELKAIAEQTGLSVTALLIVAIWKNVLKLKRLQQ